MEEQLSLVETKREYLVSHTKKIRESLSKIVDEFMYIGFLLWEVREYAYYEGMGYSDVVEYAEKELNIKRSSTFNFIKLCETYSEPTKSGVPTYKLKKQYKEYTGSQLTEMLALSPAKREEITPDMSVRQIRKSKAESKGEKEPEQDEEEIEIVQTSGLETEEILIVGLEAEFKKLQADFKKLEAKVNNQEEFRQGLSDLMNCITNDYQKTTKQQIVEYIQEYLTSGQMPDRYQSKEGQAQSEVDTGQLPDKDKTNMR